MRRRDFASLVGASVATGALPRTALAQQAAKLPHVAYLDTPRVKYFTDGFFQGLADRGYIDGKNVVVDWFTAPTNADMPAFAARAIASAPAIILAGGTAATLTAAPLTKTIPIVFRTNYDPVAQGFISNLAHPDGNVTGAAALGAVVAAKLFGFLKEMVPGLSRVAFLGRSADGIPDTVQRADVLAAGKATGIDIIMIDVTDIDNLPAFYAQAVAARAQAVFIGGYAYQSAPISLAVMNALAAGQKQQPTYNAAFQASANNMTTKGAVLSYLALLNGLPGVSGAVGGAAGETYGGFLIYGESLANAFRRAAYFVVDIIRGARPQDLSVELPTKYELQLNLKTAKALGLTVPQSVLLAATETFE